MIPIQDTAVREMIAPTTLGDGTSSATSVGVVDTRGFDYGSVIFSAGTPDNTNRVISALKLQHSDTTDSTAFVDIAVGGTDFDLPGTNTESPETVVIHTNLLPPRKRYLRLSVTADQERAIAAVAVLSRSMDSSIAGDGSEVVI